MRTLLQGGRGRVLVAPQMTCLLEATRLTEELQRVPSPDITTKAPGMAGLSMWVPGRPRAALIVFLVCFIVPCPAVLQQRATRTEHQPVCRCCTSQMLDSSACSACRPGGFAVCTSVPEWLSACPAAFMHGHNHSCRLAGSSSLAHPDAVSGGPSYGCTLKGQQCVYIIAHFCLVTEGGGWQAAGWRGHLPAARARRPDAAAR